jgi:hypothetical protein
LTDGVAASATGVVEGLQCARALVGHGRTTAAAIACRPTMLQALAGSRRHIGPLFALAAA